MFNSLLKARAHISLQGSLNSTKHIKRGGIGHTPSLSMLDQYAFRNAKVLGSQGTSYDQPDS